MQPLHNPKQEKFCQLKARGYSGAAAYREAYRCSKATAGTSAGVLIKKPHVRARLDYIQNELRKIMERETQATAVEVGIYLTDTIRTPPCMVDENSPLAQEVRRTEVVAKDGTRTITTVVKMPSKLGAADQLCKLLAYYPKGEDTAPTGENPFSAIIARLRQPGIQRSKEAAREN